MENKLSLIANLLLSAIAEADPSGLPETEPAHPLTGMLNEMYDKLQEYRVVKVEPTECDFNSMKRECLIALLYHSSQSELKNAKEIGISKAELSHYKKDRNISTEKLHKLAQINGFNICFILADNSFIIY